MLQSEIEFKGSYKRCISVYQIWDDSMTNFKIVQNNTAVVEKADYGWTMIEKDECGHSLSAASSGLCRRFNIIVLFCVYLVSNCV